MKNDNERSSKTHLFHYEPSKALAYAKNPIYAVERKGRTRQMAFEEFIVIFLNLDRQKK